MKPQDLFNAVGNIDDNYISEFADTSKFGKKKIFFLSPRFYSGIAAVFVIGIAVILAVQKNSAPIDIQNDSVHNNTAVSETKQNESISPALPYSNKSADNAGDYIHDDIYNAETNNNAYAEEPRYDESRTANEQVRDVLFSIKVYAAEIPEDLSKNNTVQIKGDFNPFMSSSRGIGIEFEVTPYSPITLKAESGYFVTWDTNTGEITNHSSSLTLSEKSDIFWTFDSQYKDTSIKVMNGNSVLSAIKIRYDEDSNTFYAENIDQT